MKYWEIIADNLTSAGWSWGCVSGVDSRGRTMFVADAHRDDGQRFTVRVRNETKNYLAERRQQNLWSYGSGESVFAWSTRQG